MEQVMVDHEGSAVGKGLRKKLKSILRCRAVHHALLRKVDPRAWHTKSARGKCTVAEIRRVGDRVLNDT
jgi:hypothetical protein